MRILSFVVALSIAACTSQTPGTSRVQIQIPPKPSSLAMQAAGDSDREWYRFTVEAADLEAPVSVTGEVDGTEIFLDVLSGSGRVFSASLFSDGDLKRATYEGTSEPVDLEPGVEASVTIDVHRLNAAPTLSSAQIATQDYFTDSVITVAAEGYDDINGDAPVYTYAWMVNGEEIPGEATHTLDGAFFAKGDLVKARITPNDGLVNGEPIESNEVTILNSAPVMQSANFVNAPFRKSDIISVAATATDADGDEIMLSYEWTVNGAADPEVTDTYTGGQPKSAGKSIGRAAGGVIFKGDILQVTVTPSDGFDNGNSLATQPETIINTVPMLGNADIAPVVPNSTSTLLVNLAGEFDEDGDAVSYLYQWFVNGVENPVTSSSLAGAFFRGDAVFAVLTPTDGEGFGIPVSTVSVAIGNAPPTYSSVDFGAGPFTVIDVVAAAGFGYNDPDGDAEGTPFVEWTIDGSPVGSSVFLSLSGFSKGQSIGLTMTPYDGFDYGVTPVSAEGQVIQNSVPVISLAADLGAGPYHVADTIAMVASPISSDADLDLVSYTYEWYINSFVVGAEVSSTLLGVFVKGDVVFVRTTPTDGTNTGSPADSNTVTIANSLPTLSSVTIDPGPATIADTLTASPAGFSDADADSWSFTQYAWFVNGIQVSSALTLDLSSFAKGDTVMVSASAFDGEAYGPWTGSGIISIENSIPVLTSATASPATAYETSVISVSPMATDADAIDNPIQAGNYSYNWYVNGAYVHSGADISGSQFNKGDTVAVEVVYSDGADLSAPYWSNVITILNSIPEITSAADIGLGPFYVGSTLSISAQPMSTDVDLDFVIYSYQWYVNGAPAPGEISSTFTGGFVRGDEVYVETTPSDGEQGGLAFNSNTVTIVNSAPSLSSVAIEPGVHTVADVLLVSTTGYFDADGDSQVAPEYIWFLNGTSVSTSPVLGLSGYAKGDTVMVSARAFDGVDFGSWVASPQIAILNSLPIVQSLSLSAGPYLETSSITATPSATDADLGDNPIIPGNYAYNWFVNGINVFSGAAITGSSFAKHDTVAVEVTYTDGTDVSTSMWSSTVTILNSIPAISSVGIGGGPFYTNDNISIQSITPLPDADGDSLSYQRAWYVNGVTVAGQTGPSLDGTFFDKGDTVYVAVAPNDGEDTGAPVNSNTVTIQNSVPVVIDVGAMQSLSFRRIEAANSGYGGAVGPTCGVANGGGVWCWGGLNTYGQLGDGTTNIAASPVAVTGISGTTDVAVGASHACALIAGVVKCWGRNDAGQLGDGTFTNSLSSVNVSGLTNVKSIAAGGGHNCALMVDGSVNCWGWNGFGQLGDGSVANRNSPQAVSGVTGVEAIAAGESSTCALINDGSVKCWGRNAQGNIGDGTNVDRLTAVSVSGVTDATVIDLGDRHACIIRIGGAVQCWGRGPEGQLGSTDTTDQWTPVSVLGLTNAVTLGLGRFHSCAVTLGGFQWCWGTNVYGQLGDGSITGATTPVAVLSAGFAVAIAGGDGYSCNLLDTGGVECWGDGGFGQMGDGTFNSYLVPNPILNSAPLGAGPIDEYAFLTAVPTITDDDSSDNPISPGGNTYTWYVNGVSVSTGSTLDGSYFDVGDSVYVQVTYTDGTDVSAPATSGTAQSANAAPQLTVTIPGLGTHTAGTSIVLGVTSIDPDTGGAPALTYRWFVNGVLVPTQTTGMLATGYALRGDSVYALVIADDGNGAVVSAYSPIDVLVNQPPNAAMVALDHTGDLFATIVSPSFDFDIGDTVTYTYVWYKNNVQQGFPTTQTSVSAASLVVGDTWRVVVTPNDGFGNGPTSQAQRILSDWRIMASLPFGRMLHTAVWTGRELIVWGGQDYTTAETTVGLRFNPVTNSWSAISAISEPNARFNHAAAWTGRYMIVWGGMFSGSPRNDGGRYEPASDSWLPLNTSGSPSPRSLASAVWTGREFLIWGGYSGGYESNGAAYDPVTDGTWRALPPSPLTGRTDHVTVWTGREVLIWGGNDGVRVSDGARYDAAANVWYAMATTNAPTAREAAAAVWTGTEMIVWGGSDGSLTSNGASYDPATNGTWKTLPAAPLAPRWKHQAVWTGGEMLVWGGALSAMPAHDGATYDPRVMKWSTLNPPIDVEGRENFTMNWTGASLLIAGGVNVSNVLDSVTQYIPPIGSWSEYPMNSSSLAARSGAVAEWTGKEMLIWSGYAAGGTCGSFTVYQDGERYNPVNDSWTPMTNVNAPAARTNGANGLWTAHAWTGSQMLVWGGLDWCTSTAVAGGGAYDPASDTWTTLPTLGEPTYSRYGMASAWTGRELLVWGGNTDVNGYQNDGAAFNPALNAWRPITSASAPAARVEASAVWTGREMIVWGGWDGTYPNIGGRYDPDSDTWQSLPAPLAMAGRNRHTAVWTGREMIVWGGTDGAFNLNNGERYDPSTNTWSTMAAGPQLARDLVSFWTGREMLVAGGIRGAGGQQPGSLMAYDPKADAWEDTPTAGNSKGQISAVYIGKELIVWGGTDTVSDFASGSTLTRLPEPEVDGDGLTDARESLIGTNPALDDTDGDGLSDGAEALTYGTDPLDSDSDNDSLSDAAEVNSYFSNPLAVDPDGDGLTDSAEVLTYFTNPNSSDSDTDGLDDYAEIVTHATSPTAYDSDSDGLGDYAEIITYGSDPNVYDTDGDGIPDGTEVNTYGLNPVDPDYDDDGLNDGTEFSYSANPFVGDSDSDGLLDGAEVFTYGSNPTSNDSDFDGVNDGAEVNTYMTSPTIGDTDGDLLSDGAEVNTHLTNPLITDTDGGGADDGKEVNIDFTDPNFAGDDIP